MGIKEFDKFIKRLYKNIEAHNYKRKLQKWSIIMILI